jgi:two-component sensor histidine kinase
MSRYQQGAAETLSVPPAAAHAITQTRTTVDDVPLLLEEINHRIRNLLAMIEAVLGQTQSITVEEYRAKVRARISGLRNFYEVIGGSGAGEVGLAELLERTMRPYCSAGGRVIAGGPDVRLNPKLALSLHLVVHELANNARKYGALSSTDGTVKISWALQPGTAARKLAVIWNEDGGPEVKPPQRRGFGSRLIVRALDAYGEVRVDFRPTGLACFMLLEVGGDI